MKRYIFISLLFFVNVVSYAQNINEIQQSAEQGNAMAQCNLGYCYDEGNGVPQDYSKAVYWYPLIERVGN